MIINCCRNRSATENSRVGGSIPRLRPRSTGARMAFGGSFSASRRWSLERRSGTPRRQSMERQSVQQVVDYLKTHPDIAKKALDFFRAHPDDVKGALRQVAQDRGWDLSNIDTAALKAEFGKLS